MYHIGDKVVYPMHGAGIIEAIEKKEILGEKKDYYVLRFPIGDMKVMVPVSNVNDLGLREIIGKGQYEKVIQYIKHGEIHMPSNWNRRYRVNLDKIRSGDIFEVAEVVRSLILRDREKGLSTGERKMLNSAKQILISELVLASGRKQTEIESMLDI